MSPCADLCVIEHRNELLVLLSCLYHCVIERDVGRRVAMQMAFYCLVVDFALLGMMATMCWVRNDNAYRKEPEHRHRGCRFIFYVLRFHTNHDR